MAEYRLEVGYIVGDFLYIGKRRYPVNILLVDDHVLFRAGMRYLLRRLDVEYELDEADNCVDAIEPLKMGATACFTCPIDGDRFQKALESVIAQVNLMNETDALERLLVEKYTYAGIVARNPQMLELFRFLRKIAPYYRPSPLPERQARARRP